MQKEIPGLYTSDTAMSILNVSVDPFSIQSFSNVNTHESIQDKRNCQLILTEEMLITKEIKLRDFDAHLSLNILVKVVSDSGKVVYKLHQYVALIIKILFDFVSEILSKERLKEKGSSR